MQNSNQKWLYLGVLSLVWGSSFILIKKSLIGLSPMQVGALRNLFASVFLFLIGFKSIKKIKKTEWKWVIISACSGTFIPAFLFAFAETEIDSAITSILNSTTPLITLLLGSFVFSIGYNKNQLIGILIGFIGCLALVLEGASVNPHQNYWYALLVIIASFFYAYNVNIIKKYMQNTSPIAITSGGFMVLIIPSLIVLCYSNFFDINLITNTKVQSSLIYVFILAII